MICNRPLTTAEMASSQRNYLLYNGVNGASYMCLGETVLILFAVKLHCSDTVVAILGGMIFFGFLLLPLGKIMTARVGAARSQADFWVMRNIAALVVAAAAPAAVKVVEKTDNAKLRRQERAKQRQALSAEKKAAEKRVAELEQKVEKLDARQQELLAKLAEPPGADFGDLMRESAIVQDKLDAATALWEEAMEKLEEILAANAAIHED